VQTSLFLSRKILYNILSILRKKSFGKRKNNLILGVDYSHWQSLVSADKLRAKGVTFAFVKAGEVLASKPTKPLYKDNLHDRNITELKRVGILCGDYYYFHPSAGASKQARHYAEIYLKNPPTLPPVIDVEDNDRMRPAEVGRQLLAFIGEVAQRIGRQPIIYSRNAFLVNQAGNPDWPAGTLIWIARYDKKIGDLSPKIKPNVVMWQFTDRLKLPGLPLMDGNYWLRSLEELKQLAVAGSSVPLPGVDEPDSFEPDIKSGRVVVSRLNVRNKPSESGKIVGALNLGDVVPILAIVNTYWADMGSGRFAAIRGKTGTYIEFISASGSDAKLGFSPMRRKIEKVMESLFFRQKKDPKTDLLDQDLLEK
jgi:GH25 family lysozyme M1 (1,4-beta-N-acetylmuramidase)